MGRIITKEEYEDRQTIIDEEFGYEEEDEEGLPCCKKCNMELSMETTQSVDLVCHNCGHKNRI